ncbi:unnamed protein product [Trichogramma brassicae]|uniref:YDG domain-containing protein n=1 Tax=Trichogramma brassicae TaxID=86971 RepID=A0A6H5I7G1_9HYME|nr:unnamed protein product [Trichogramma brassicae]
MASTCIYKSASGKEGTIGDDLVIRPLPARLRGEISRSRRSVAVTAAADPQLPQSNRTVIHPALRRTHYHVVFKKKMPRLGRARDESNGRTVHTKAPGGIENESELRRGRGPRRHGQVLLPRADGRRPAQIRPGQRFRHGRGHDEVRRYHYALNLCHRDPFGGTLDCEAAGYAYRGGACSVSLKDKMVRAVGMVEDNGGYVGIVPTAHEIRNSARRTRAAGQDLLSRGRGLHNDGHNDAHEQHLQVVAVQHGTLSGLFRASFSFDYIDFRLMKARSYIFNLFIVKMDLNFQQLAEIRVRVRPTGGGRVASGATRQDSLLGRAVRQNLRHLCVRTLHQWKVRRQAGEEDRSGLCPAAFAGRTHRRGVTSAFRGREELSCVMFIPKDWVVKPKGLIEGIKVGTRWSKREHVAAAGVHTPLQQGISGDRIQGANSIVLSGGYEDNIDCGDIIYYTGCGGVTNGVQTSDQPWNNLNESLAINCGAKIDRTEGVLATDWNKCFPVRVVKKTSAARAKRKNKKNTENTEEYFVFIGIYRVCGCWPVRGKSRFRVWRFLLVKDNGDSNKVFTAKITQS